MYRLLTETVQAVREKISRQTGDWIVTVRILDPCNNRTLPIGGGFHQRKATQ